MSDTRLGRWAVDDEMVKIGIRYFKGKVFRGEISLSEDSYLLNSDFYRESFLHALYTEVSKAERTRAIAAVKMTLQRKRNKQKNPSRRLQVKQSTGDRLIEIARRKECTVSDLIDKAIESLWDDHSS